jgi:hypothetical protein
LSVVICTSRFSIVAVGALKTARVEPTLVGFTGIVFQSKTAEPITGFWSATANAPAVAATAMKATIRSLRVIIVFLLCQEAALDAGGFERLSRLSRRAGSRIVIVAPVVPGKLALRK